jgi:hypothetical protein
MPGLAGGEAGGHLTPGQRPDPRVQQRLVWDCPGVPVIVSQ